GEVFKVWASVKPDAGKVQDDSAVQPGTVLNMNDRGLEVATGSGSIWLTHVQPAGKKAMTVSELKRGAPIPAGTVLGV
ncbi:MAG: methionyl-tRNA formyltransferase, partial [Paenibacillus sp.]|nr:methionyl-tRNA formyltransferase [Paenibacillus sp.]